MHKSILEVVHESAKDMHDIGLIDAVTMREFDALCLPEIHKLSSKEIKKLRLREKVNEKIFAKFLNISATTVKQWENGAQHPSGAALKLLNLVMENGIGFIA